MEERLQQLISQRDSLSMQLSEINFLIKGYEDTLKNQEQEGEEAEEVSE